MDASSLPVQRSGHRPMLANTTATTHATATAPQKHSPMTSNYCPNRVSIKALVGTVFVLLVTFVQAATFQWTNTASGTFLNAANWTNTTTPFANGTPGAADVAGNNIAGSTTTVGVGDTVSVTTFQPTAGAFSMTGGTLNVANAL